MWEPTDKSVQLVKHLHKVPEKKRVFPAMASIKYDGVFGFALPDGRIYSRAGNLCKSLDKFSDAIRQLQRKNSFNGLSQHVLIFEVYVHGWKMQQISGAFRRQSEQFTEATLMIHDAIPYASFMAGACSTSFKYRTMVAKAYADDLEVAYVEQAVVVTEEDAYELARVLIQSGHEGIVLRDPNAGYKAGARNESCTKIKLEEKAKCLVVAVEEGVGKNKGIASVVVDFQNGTQCVSGGSYDDRAKWWAKPSMVVGKTAIIEYMCVTPDGRMREPRLKGFV